MKVLFFGTPEIAALHLRALAGSTHQIAAVITKPDAPKGRGQTLKPSETKTAASALGLSPVLTPSMIKNPEFLEEIKKFKADLGVVVAYGKIFPKAVIEESTRLGLINVHFSLLPKLRGPSPVETAILEGHDETGVTTFWIEESCDTGDMILQQSLAVLPHENAPQLRGRLGELGARLLLESLDLIEKGKAPRLPQNHEAATQSRIIRKEDGLADFQKESAEAIERKIRAYREWPKVQAELFGKKMSILAGEALPEEIREEWRIVKGKGFVLKCLKGSLLVTEIQAEGKPPASAWSFLQGLRLNQ